MKKKKIIIGIIVLLVIIGGISYELYKNKTKFIGTPLEPIYKLVNIIHFNKGTYGDYKRLFTDSNSILSEQQFKGNRENNSKSDSFKYDGDSIDKLMKHMIYEKLDGNVYKINYLKNVNDEKEKKVSNYWLVTKKDNKWLIKND